MLTLPCSSSCCLSACLQLAALSEAPPAAKPQEGEEPPRPPQLNYTEPSAINLLPRPSIVAPFNVRSPTGRPASRVLLLPVDGQAVSA